MASSRFMRLALHSFKHPGWFCGRYFLDDVVHLETQALYLFVPSWKSFTTCRTIEIQLEKC